MTPNSPLLPGLIVPIVFILLGAFCKKIVRSGSFVRDDFFMGIELTLAAFSLELIFLIETFQKSIKSSNEQISGQTLLHMSVSLLITFVVLIIVFAMHQSYTKPSVSAKMQYLSLTFFSNLLGSFTMISFVVAKEWGAA